MIADYYTNANVRRQNRQTRRNTFCPIYNFLHLDKWRNKHSCKGTQVHTGVAD